MRNNILLVVFVCFIAAFNYFTAAFNHRHSQEKNHGNNREKYHDLAQKLFFNKPDWKNELKRTFRHDLDEHWKKFKNNFLKDSNKDEEKHRRIWEDRFDFIEKFNKNLRRKFKLGINEFSHIKHEDFVNHYTGYQPRSRRNVTHENFMVTWEDSSVDDYEDAIYAEVDWRRDGIITPVRNQKQCGSCWAFASAAILEAYHFMKLGKNVSLSVQNLMDCSKDEGTHSCSGGSMDGAFAYIIKNKGIMSEKDYPYTMKDSDQCSFKKKKIVSKCSKYVNLPKGDEKALQKSVQKVGPVAVAIDASHESFQDYQGGIYDEPECDPDSLNHAVLVVGYGTEDDDDYWLIKNSWGTTWGIDGYMKMARNNNQCGIANEANYPVI